MLPNPARRSRAISRFATRRLATPHVRSRRQRSPPRTPSSLTSLYVTAVQPAIKSDRRRKEPGTPEIIRTTLKGDLVERVSPLTLAENLLAEPHAEIARHRDAGTAIAHRKMNPVFAADMGQLVECISDEPHPGAADSHGSEFRE